MAPDPHEPEHSRRRNDNGWFAYLDRRLSKSAKIATAITTIVGGILLGGGIVSRIDGLYVHTDVFAGEVGKINERLDKSDLRTLEGQLRTVNAQIFELERQVRLTSAEQNFLTSLRGDAERIRAEIRDLRETIIQNQKKAQRP